MLRKHSYKNIKSTVDDELERSNRRNDADILKRVSNISSPRRSFNEKEIADHIQVCLKMHAENKISSKNAWNLKIIDFMRTLLHSKAVAKDTLQVGSSSLDVSAKVYGIRVDDIHSDGLKLASTMARTNIQKDAETGEDGEAAEGDNQENDGQQQKKKKKKRMALNTIAKDPNSLLGDVQKMESVFFQSRSVREPGASEPLFTNKLPIDHNGYQFMLLTPKHAWASYDKIDPLLLLQKTFPFKLTEIKLQIFNQFPHFQIDEWDIDTENAMLKAQSLMQEEVAFDAEGVPIPELDGSVHDLFANIDDDNHYASTDEEESEPLEQAAINTHKVAHIVNFNPEHNDNLHLNDYSYSAGANIKGNRRMTQVWAGPSHWKLKHIRRTVSRFSGQQDKQPCKSVRKPRLQPVLIDFLSDEVPVLTTKLYKIKRYHIFEDPIKCTLPQVLYTSNKRCLMLKPVYLQKFSTNPIDAIPSEVGPYNYENPNDSQYCSQHGVGDDNDFGNNDNNDDGGFNTDDNVDENAVAMGGNFEGNNLIDAPELVPKSYIQYALQAKKMDMKKLKTAEWKCLVSKTSNEVVPEDDMFNRKVEPTTFSGLYSQLPRRITDKMKQELTCPLAFVALLHLANEHNLELTNQDDLHDFKIEQITNST